MAPESQVAVPPPGLAGGEFAIDAFALPDALSPDYVAQLVVKQLPGMHELFREEFFACGRPWSQPRYARAAAFARGQQWVRQHLCSLAATPGNRPAGPDDCGAPWPLPLPAERHAKDVIV